MKYFLLVLFSFSLYSTAYTSNKIIYLEPSPEAKYVSTENNIIIGFENPIRLNKDEIKACITVEGAKSGRHEGTVIICEGARKILFKPSSSFQSGETVSLNLTGKLIKSVYPYRKKYSFHFTTSLYSVHLAPDKIWNISGNYTSPIESREGGLIQPPPLIVTTNNNPSPGYLFTAPFNGYSSLVIVKDNGTPYWYRTVHSLAGDFKKQPNGDLTYYDEGTHKHYEMDINYNLVDTFYCGNGYYADIHELRVLNNEHALLMAYDTQTVDMSQIVSGGNPHARVVGLIIQEIDENKNVVFQWRSWDHFQITDALHENLLDSTIDAVHGNAIELDDDGNLLISSRHLDEITKISRSTGAIIWRLGGLNNQFTFINDSIRFTYQHAVRKIPNGDITIFDNGNFHNPPFSRAVEYSLDEINKTATLVWQYRKTPDVFGFWGGYVQRLENGNTLIAWGGTRPTVTEVKPDGTIVFEGSYQQNIYTYRAYKFDWNGAAIAVNGENSKIPASFKLHQNYPNPFNPATVITYDIPKSSYVELSVFDVTGRELKKLVSEFKKPGSYSVSFDGSQYSSGLYICRLKAGGFTASGKMILIK
jgi:hypothetical protein